MSYKDIKSFEQECREKDVEIERLKAVIEDLSDHGCAAERMERLKTQNAEIERLKALLTRAADALEGATKIVRTNLESDLIAELRKTIQ